MKRIAVIGESPNDTVGLCRVWNKKFEGRGHFSVFLRRVRGAKLDSGGKMRRLIAAELKSTNYELFIYVRDLDGFASSKTHVEKVQNWYKMVSSLVAEGLLLVNIQSIEALLLADIETFNKEYRTRIKFDGNPEMYDSKAFLKSKTALSLKKYHENDCMQLIPKLNFEKVESRCESYREFIIALGKSLK